MAKRIVALPLDNVEVGMVTADFIEIFDKKGLNIIVAKPNTVLSKSILDRMKLYKIKEIPVFLEMPDDAEESPPNPAIDVPPIESMIGESLRDEAVAGIRNLFDAAAGTGSKLTTAYQAVKELNNIVDQLVDTISSEANSLVHISDLKSYDEYTYHHSLSVAVLSIAIGQEMGLNDEQLRELGQCAIMHDIGKTTISPELINKPGRLTKEEFDIVKKHAENGGKYLAECEIGDIKLWNIVSHHHEKIDGSGYPKGLTGKDIPLFSQIISVADVYDAVTSYRSYRTPMSPAEAIELVMSEIGRSFDYGIVSSFIEKLELYPINTVVELSDSRLGAVVDNTNAMRPILKMLDDDTSLDLMGLDNLNLVITKVLKPDEG